MTRILVISTPNDIHAMLAIFALRRHGCDAGFWCPADIPQVEQPSIRFFSNGSLPEPERISRSGGSDFPIYDTVLFRKYSRAQIAPDLHPADAAVARREFNYFIDGCFSMISREAFWCNPWISLFTSGKISQLQAAMKLGMKVPETLISCNPAAIREFVGASGPGGAVFKSFAPAVWQNGSGESAVAMTAQVTDDVLRDDYALSNVPGIYQHRIAKSHEIRVTMFGHHGVLAKLNSQDNELTRLDWRVGGRELSIEPMATDDRIIEKCTAMLKELNLTFGCFDFVVDRDGEIIFLEVNPVGQFIWMEEINPDIRLLAPFCEFLRLGSLEYRPASPSSFGRLSDFAESPDFIAFQNAMTERHSLPQSSCVHSE